MSSPAVLIATAKIRPGGEDAFAAWKGRHDAAVAAFPGFISSDIMPPGEHDDAWTILLNFDSREHLAAWQQSGERAAILAELAPLMIGGDLGEVMQADSPDAAQPGTTVTQVIFSRIKPGMEEQLPGVGRPDAAGAGALSGLSGDVPPAARRPAAPTGSRCCGSPRPSS